MSDQLMLSAVDFPVRTSASPVARPGSTVRAAAYGDSSPVLLASFDPASSSWRTCKISLVALASGLAHGLDEFSETWPRSGLMRSGTAFLLEPLAPLTSATGSGLWPTRPWAAAAILPRLLTPHKMWPTPIRRDGRTFLGGRRSPNALGSEPLVTQAGGNLNPPWVAWLMGFPVTWLDGVSAPLKASGTQSSPRFPS